MENTHKNLVSKKILTDQDLESFYSNYGPSKLSRTIILKIIKYIHIFMEGTFIFLGLHGRGYQNALDLQVDYKEIILPNLPTSFINIKILLLSDFHLGTIKELPKIIIDKIKNLEVDLCLLGGDYRHCCTNPTLPFLEDLEEIVSSINPSLGIYGVLGNHDGPEIIPAMERMGIKMLINDSVRINKGTQYINLIGIDEFNVFRRHDLEMAFQNVSSTDFNILLSHSPDLFKQAESHGSDLYLCGHTHHGQIQFPIIGPVVTFTSAPRKLAIGDWKYKGMEGYTSPGLGTVAAPVRFRCPPMATVLTLKGNF
jgi:uncharacterized protein